MKKNTLSCKIESHSCSTHIMMTTSAFACFLGNHLKNHEHEFRECCKNNDVLGAMDIYNMHRGMDIGFNDDECFSIVAENGNIVFVQWIYSIHYVHPTYPEKIIISVSKKGYLTMLQWMHAIGFIENVSMKSAYFCACNNHDSAMANWIIDTYPYLNKNKNDDFICN